MTSYRRVALSLGIAPSASDEELEIDLLSSSPLGGDADRAPITGTRALMLAVLEDAIRCYLDGRKHASEEAERWIMANWRESPFTFVIVCETLRLDPEAVRRSLREMKKAKVSSRDAIPRARNNVRVPGRVCTRKPSRPLRRCP
jgi:hypothetical protein